MKLFSRKHNESYQTLGPGLFPFNFYRFLSFKFWERGRFKIA